VNNNVRVGALGAYCETHCEIFERASSMLPCGNAVAVCQIPMAAQRWAGAKRTVTDLGIFRDRSYPDQDKAYMLKRDKPSLRPK